MLLEHFPNDIQVDQVLHCHTNTHVKPFAWVDDMYLQRLEYKNKGYGAERILKLALNSLYGKMAQQTGAKKIEGKWKIPSYHQLEWAGWVTSSTRAKLFQAAMKAPDDIIAFETDAVFSKVPLQLSISKALGDWGEDQLTNLTYVQTGVSWASTEHESKAKYRGFDEGSFEEIDVLSAWHQGLTAIPGRTTRFQSLGYSWNTNDMRNWRAWQTKERNLAIIPERSQGRTLKDTSPITSGEMRNLDIYSSAYDVGVGRPYYLAWKDREYEQLSFGFDEGEDL
jgi:hypothetical protein